MILPIHYSTSTTHSAIYDAVEKLGSIGSCCILVRTFDVSSKTGYLFSNLCKNSPQFLLLCMAVLTCRSKKICFQHFVINVHWGLTSAVC